MYCRGVDALNHHHLFHFWTVVREGGVTRASEKLNVSQPTVSGQLRELQEALGEKLLVRSGRTVVLTDVGRTVYRYADEIFALGRVLQQAVKGRRRHIGPSDGTAENNLLVGQTVPPRQWRPLVLVLRVRSRPVRKDGEMKGARSVAEASLLAAGPRSNAERQGTPDLPALWHARDVAQPRPRSGLGRGRHAVGPPLERVTRSSESLSQRSGMTVLAITRTAPSSS
jgi:DNA-binding transcriptional ArsR family regulator